MHAKETVTGHWKTEDSLYLVAKYWASLTVLWKPFNVLDTCVAFGEELEELLTQLVFYLGCFS